MSQPPPDAPSPQPEFSEEDVERTINPASDVDQASFESFPASDPPGFTGSSLGPESLPDPDASAPAEDR